jgi:hypothetical protein
MSKGHGPGYAEFADDVKIIFSDIIGKYFFKISDQDSSRVVLDSPGCRITIKMMGYYEVYVMLSNPSVSNEEFNYGSVIKILERKTDSLPKLNSNDKAILDQEKGTYRSYISLQVRTAALAISTCLPDILFGNKDWVKKVGDAEHARDHEIRFYLEKVNALDFNHPVHQLFHQNDPRWIGEIKKLFKYQ